MNRQEIYDKVKAHLIAQGKRSMNVSGCAYRGLHGAMCAVGVLIPDSAYSWHIESRGADDLCDPATSAKHIDNADMIEAFYRVHDSDPETFASANQSFLLALQAVHDDPSNWNDGFIGRTELVAVADRFGLQP